MTYYINIDETWKVYDATVYRVEANSAKEAYEKYKNGEADYYDTVGTDYGDLLHTELESIEEETGKEVTYELDE